MVPKAALLEYVSVFLKVPFVILAKRIKI